MDLESILYKQEIYRAKAVMRKAERDNENLGTVLRDHMVSQKVILELTGQTYEYVPPKKKVSSRDRLEEWCKNNIGLEIKPGDIMKETELSYSVVTKFIRERRDLFQKIEKGHHKVRDPETERLAEKEDN